MTFTPDFAERLAHNVKSLRVARGLTQAGLAERSGVARTTLSLLESGSANPSLEAVLRLSDALEVPLDELLEARGPQTHVCRKAERASKTRGGVTIEKLLPERIAGVELEQLTLPPGRVLTGVPHLSGIREYLVVHQGRIELRVAGESFVLDAGDVAVFHGNQRHSYHNPGRSVATALSVLALTAPLPPV